LVPSGASCCSRKKLQVRLYGYAASTWNFPPVAERAHDQRTSPLSPQASSGTPEITICSLSFWYALPPWITLTASVTAIVENAQQVPYGCCCWIGPTAPFSTQLMLTEPLAPLATASSSSVNEKEARSADADI
jgi:hypothetical protein